MNREGGRSAWSPSQQRGQQMGRESHLSTQLGLIEPICAALEIVTRVAVSVTDVGFASRSAWWADAGEAPRDTTVSVVPTRAIQRTDFHPVLKLRSGSLVGCRRGGLPCAPTRSPQSSGLGACSTVIAKDCSNCYSMS